MVACKMAKDKKKKIDIKKVPDFKSDKKVVANVPSQLYKKPPNWSFSKCDFVHEEWGVNTNKDSLQKIILRLIDFENQKTWGAILTNTAGRTNNTQSHQIDVYKIAKRAQNRLVKLGLSEYDEIYSLSVGGKYRIWGVMSVESGTFHLIWLDKNHTVYPVGKRHT